MTRLFVLFCALITLFSTIEARAKNKYDFLWEKDLGEYGCLAAYQGDSLLYFVFTAKRSGYVPPSGYAPPEVAVYDPRTSIFATVPLRYKGDKSCRDLNFSRLPVLGFAGLNFVEAPGFRAIFDNFREDPEALKNAIDAGPVYFKQGELWNGERSAINLPGKNIRVESLDDVSSYLMRLSDESAIVMINERKSFLADTKVRMEAGRAAYEARVAAEDMRKKVAREAWDNRMSQKMGIGDKVCTFNTNFFGFIENIVGEKVKVQVVGQAAPAGGTPGYFFSGEEGRFQYSRIESIRWFERSELGRCSFD